MIGEVGQTFSLVFPNNLTSLGGHAGEGIQSMPNPLLSLISLQRMMIRNRYCLKLIRWKLKFLCLLFMATNKTHVNPEGLLSWCKALWGVVTEWSLIQVPLGGHQRFYLVVNFRAS